MPITHELATLMRQDFEQPDDFDWLLEQDFICFNSVKRQQWQLNVRHYIGIIQLPSGQQLEILPKLTHPSLQHDSQILQVRQWVQIMLQQIFAKLSPQMLPNIVKQNWIFQNGETSLFHWLGQYFITLIYDYDFNKTYQPLEVNQKFLTGKILFHQQLQFNLNKPYQFFHLTEQLSINTACNRLIKTTANYLQLPLQQLNDLWQQIPLLSFKEMSSYWQQSQLELAYLPKVQQQKTKYILEICQWILQSSAVYHGFGQHHYFSLLINMQDAFEKWVNISIQQQLIENNQVFNLQTKPKVSILTDENQQTVATIQPDILLKIKDKYWVMDIKWKMIGQNSIIHQDIYQLLVYQSQFMHSQAWLIYPAHQHFTKPKILYHQAQKTIQIVPFCVKTQRLLVNFL